MGRPVTEGRPNPEEEWKRWVAWLGEASSQPSIQDDVVAMLAARQVWDSFRLVYNNAPYQAHKMQTMMSWVSESYSHRQAMAIRRQLDLDHDVISLAKLIDRVRRYPDVLSRDRYASQTAGWMSRAEADGFFDKMIGVGRDHIDQNVPRGELAKLKAATQKVVDFADNEVAHYNAAKGTFSVGLKFRDVHSAVDAIADLFIRYRLRILGSSTDRHVGMLDWIHIFNEGWIPDDDHFNRVLRQIREIEGKRKRGEPLEDHE
jgi:hypothetical protein